MKSEFATMRDGESVQGRPIETWVVG